MAGNAYGPGDSGAAVTTIQTQLNSMGLGPLDVDGQFGALTSEAVKQFQNANGLVVDGLVGVETWPLLTGTDFPTSGPTPSTAIPVNQQPSHDSAQVPVTTKSNLIYYLAAAAVSLMFL